MASVTTGPRRARLPRQNEPFAGTTAHSCQTPLHHHPNLLRARATQTTQRPGTAKRKGNPKHKTDERVFGGVAHHNRPNFPGAQTDPADSRHQKLARPPRKFRLESFAACSSAQFPRQPPLHPTGRRVAAESRFSTPYITMGQTLSEPVVEKVRVSSSRAPPGLARDVDLVAVQLAEQGRARQGKARQGKATRVGALPRWSARYPSSDRAAAARMPHRVAGLLRSQFRVRDYVACPTRSIVLPQTRPRSREPSLSRPAADTTAPRF